MNLIPRSFAGRIGVLLLLAFLLLAAVVIARTLGVARAQQPGTLQFGGVPAVDVDTAANRLATAVRFETVSYDDHSEPAALANLQAWLVTTYPRFHAVATRTIVGGGTLIYEWTGRDATLAPIILMAHQDVVPIADAGRWRQEPFSGAIIDGMIWGRGALDDKSSLIAILEAAESLAASGHAPARTFLFVFGHDEESAGSGARAAASHLAERKVHAAFALDEGGIVVSEHPVTGARAALIGVAEKGYLTLEIAAEAPGGHSSQPPPTLAVAALAEALVAIRNKPFAQHYGGATQAMLETLAPSAPFASRMAIANMWLFRPLLLGQLGASPAGAAALQTTVAPTMLRASPKENVLPSVAVATVNFRIIPGETTTEVTNHVRDAVSHLPVTVKAVGRSQEPSGVSRTDTSGYRLIAGIAASIYDAPAAPLQVLGMTDSRFMRDIADDVYMFTPAQLSLEDLPTIHGTDERISVENLKRMISFYQQLIVGGDGGA